jgi:uncharacterized protein (UPF0276 family)
MSRLVAQRQGFGIGYRPELRRFVEDQRASLDVLEITPEHYIEGSAVLYAGEIAALRERFRLILHGVSANLVSMAPPDWTYFAAVRRLMELTGSPYFSDHMALTAGDGFQVGFFCPNVYNRELLEHTVSKLRAIEEFLEAPVVLEYIAYSVRLPGSAWTPEEFFLELLQRHDRLGVLLDVSNVWYNGLNFNFDYARFMEQLPADRIVHVHLAGGELVHGKWQDSHSAPVHDEVFALFKTLTQRADVDTVIIERDANYTAAQTDLIADIQRARAIWADQH